MKKEFAYILVAGCLVGLLGAGVAVAQAEAESGELAYVSSIGGCDLNNCPAHRPCAGQLFCAFLIYLL